MGFGLSVTHSPQEGMGQLAATLCPPQDGTSCNLQNSPVLPQKSQLSGEHYLVYPLLLVPKAVPQSQKGNCGLSPSETLPLPMSSAWLAFQVPRNQIDQRKQEKETIKEILYFLKNDFLT